MFRVGEAPHLNNVELGRHGRSRSNVWHYAGVNSFRAGRMDELSAHPTAKPVALVADAMKDCTRRRDIVLDTFCGSGTTLMAAERVGRRAYGWSSNPDTSMSPSDGGKPSPGAMRSTLRPAQPLTSVRSSSSAVRTDKALRRVRWHANQEVKIRAQAIGPRRATMPPPPRPLSEEEYKVGPGRPPKEYRWKPGQSGNPKGAKRKQPSLIPDLKELFAACFQSKGEIDAG